MSDLIRREDALKAAEAGPSFYMIQTDTGFRESRGGAFAIRSDISQALLALPAVQPDDDLVGHMTKLIAAGLDRIEQLTAERDRLREALNQSRLAFAGHVSVQSAIDLIDRASPKEAQNGN